ncbi:hypothetical protein [Plastoroseomonas hellenica]|uniref:Uncharacterized protein n=1 Tax=Plastoroseomonas hellenica TaxID=2687306 RepID=A0ABS5EWM9_9PROT|nr:hypothetical protein [Plastoroseomonas hellenica]MBR0641245.1 hypothetical protein [Plastoroseomonas hellenica]MBR0664713.1 hypothetical protein [Plastoroseomonas hellenica]
MTITAAPNALGMHPRALTTVVFDVIDDEGRHSLHGRVHHAPVCHPYCFVSRDAAARFARWCYAQRLCDGFALETAGFAPPERRLLIDLDELPF